MSEREGMIGRVIDELRFGLVTGLLRLALRVAPLDEVGLLASYLDRWAEVAKARAEGRKVRP